MILTPFDHNPDREGKFQNCDVTLPRYTQCHFKITISVTVKKIILIIAKCKISDRPSQYKIDNNDRRNSGGTL